MGNKFNCFKKNEICIICNKKKIDTLFLPCGHFSKINI